MKLIVPVETQSLEEPVCPSFGRTPYFILFDTETGNSDYLDNSATADQGGAGIKAAQMLVDTGAKVLITYRCGENAADVLKAGDIKMFKAENGSVMYNIQKCMKGKLSPLSDVHPGFHKHGGV